MKILINWFVIARNVASELMAVYRSVSSPAPSRPCHYQELFVKSNGDVFPCCLTWNRKSMRIGHISDDDLDDKIAKFNKSCSCDRYRMRKGESSDKRRYSMLNLELSLACQANCIMCCVKAPEWQGKYDYYPQLESLLDFTKPSEILVQGGEILIQKRSLEWLRRIKDNHPDMQISLVTNGNIDDDNISRINGLFGRITVSFVGFQPETYSKIMGLDINKTMNFVEKLLQMKDTKLYLKYLITPINVHETTLFLRWALSKKPNRIALSDANSYGYIKMNTADDYWLKIFQKVGNEVKYELIAAVDLMKSENIVISIDSAVRTMLDINETFIQEKGLTKNIDWT